MTVDRTKRVQPGSEKGISGSSAHCRVKVDRQGEEGVTSRLCCCPQSNTERPVRAPRRCDSTSPLEIGIEAGLNRKCRSRTLVYCIDSPVDPPVRSAASPVDPPCPTRREAPASSGSIRKGGLRSIRVLFRSIRPIRGGLPRAIDSMRIRGLLSKITRATW